MEQHSQAQERQTIRRQDLRREEVRRQSPEQGSLAAAGLTARALLAGAPLWELPPANLEELAGRLGNQEMLALLKRSGPQTEEVPFRLPLEELETVPFPVPEVQAGLTQPPEELAVLDEVTAAFNPAELWE